MSSVIDEIITRYVLENRYSAGANRIIQDAEKVKSRLDFAGNALIATGVATTTFAVASLRASGHMQAEIKAIEAITHNAGKARAEAEYFDKRAGTSIFSLTELTQAGKLLNAYELDTRRFLPLADDLAAVFREQGVSAAETARVFGRLNAGDFGEAFERLRDFGIGFKELEGEGLTFDNSHHYTGSVDDALAAVERIIKKRYGGISEKLATGTLEGAISNLGDQFGRLQRKAGDVALEPVTGQVRFLTRQLESLTDHLSPAVAWTILLAGPLLVVGGLALKAYGAFKLYTAIQGLSALAGAANTAATTLETGALIANTEAQVANNAAKSLGLRLGIGAGVAVAGLAVTAGVRSAYGAGSNEDYFGTVYGRGITGAGAGSVFGPVGTAVGFGAGVIGGLYEQGSSIRHQRSDAESAIAKSYRQDAELREAKRQGRGKEYLRSKFGGLSPHESLAVQGAGLDPAAVTGAIGGPKAAQTNKALQALLSGRGAAGLESLLGRTEADTLKQIAESGKETAKHSQRTSENTREAVELKGGIFGGGDLAREGISPVQFAAFRRGGGRAGGSGSEPVLVRLEGGQSLDAIMQSAMQQAITEDRRRRSAERL